LVDDRMSNCKFFHLSSATGLCVHTLMTEFGPELCRREVMFLCECVYNRGGIYGSSTGSSGDSRADDSDDKP
jgi:hypothetical protein